MGENLDLPERGGDPHADCSWDGTPGARVSPAPPRPCSSLR